MVQSIRYTLPENDEAFDNVLKHVLVDMLLTMLQDNDMEIQRLAMTTLNSAAHNKPELILPRLGQLMPYVMRASIIRPDLIREVMMGPFKHTVDEGLDLRKVRSHSVRWSCCDISLTPRVERLRDSVCPHGNGIYADQQPRSLGPRGGRPA